ncbi:carboxypeptidase A2 [Columba livia]|uniref:Carboxypeptidase A2 n=1 Tax=Columba livia TaxID=8932 RepID=A0A2I0LXA2_COLLI|nr:carboxypeptidase A2 [Columba livia]
MKLILIFSALFGASLCLETFVGHQVLRIKARNEEEVKQLQLLESLEHLELDFWTSPSSPALPVDLRIPANNVQAVKAFLESHGIEYSILIKDLQVVLDQEKQDMANSQQRERASSTFNYGTYHSLDDIYAELDHLAYEYSDIVSKFEIGRSYENRPLYVLKFSTGGTNRRAIWIDAGIHSREWVTQASAVWIAKKIASSYGQDPSITSLLNKMDIFLQSQTLMDTCSLTPRIACGARPAPGIKAACALELIQTGTGMQVLEVLAPVIIPVLSLTMDPGPTLRWKFNLLSTLLRITGTSRPSSPSTATLSS